MKTSFLFILLFTIVYSNAQIINSNPNPNGNPWYVGGYEEPTEAELGDIPELVLSGISSTITLPSSVDNSQYQYMPPIFDQIWGSCAQASGIGYIFTYEINRLRDIPSIGDDNLYDHLFTYNFLINTGFSVYGTGFSGGWDIVKQNGCASISTFNNPYGLQNQEDAIKYWMSGYDKYISAMSNRIESNSIINLYRDGSGIDLIKHWLHHHNEGSSVGGLVGMGMDFLDAPFVVVNDNYIVLNEAQDGPHAMTIVGYDDNFGYDIDGQNGITNHLDITGDGIVNMDDWEKGAFLVANSWGVGNNFGNNYSMGGNGYCYILYRAFFSNKPATTDVVYFHVIEAAEDPSIELVLKLNIGHPERTEVDLGFGYASTSNIIHPSSVLPSKMISQSGTHDPINGFDNNPIEVAFDYGNLFNNYDVGKYFCLLLNNGYDHGNEIELNKFSLVDFRWNEEFELDYNILNNILPDRYYELPINYDLIPFEINTDLSLFSNMVGRFSPTVDNSSTLTIQSGIEIDLYDCEVIIEPNSSLIIEDEVIINLRSGTNKLIINGDCQLGNNLQVFSENDAQLIIEFNNTNANISIDQWELNHTAIISYANETNVASSELTNSVIYGFSGDHNISNSEFIGSFINFADAVDEYKEINITNNCIFSGNQTNTALTIESYPNFLIDGIIIENNVSGAISIYNSGYGLINQVVSNCFIDNNGGTGILSYHSDMIIQMNEISNNGFGIRCLDRSNVSIEGNDQAGIPGQTQQITDNISYEIYASSQSFPDLFRWNAVSDPDNAEAMFYYAGSVEGLDVRYNNWGVNFNNQDDLHPWECYIYEPIWPLLGTTTSTTDAEALYLSANQNVELGNYQQAEGEFKQVVSSYPEDNYAQASLKELFYLEKHNSNNYQTLKEYYENDPTIQSTQRLNELADFLNNWCEIELENYPQAISWFENIIMNPDTIEDSIFAIIDLGYTYLQMQGNRSLMFVGNMPQYIPSSKKQYEEYRDYLLSLLKHENNSHIIDQELQKGNELIFLNSPNPFLNRTSIQINNVSSRSYSEIRIYNVHGTLIKTLNIGHLEKGNHKIEVNLGDLESGVYYYTLLMNYTKCGSRKMIKL